MLKFSKEKQIQKNIIDVQEFKETQLKESDLQRQCEEYCLLIPNIKVIRIPDAIYKAIFGMGGAKIPSYPTPLAIFWRLKQGGKK